MERRRQEEREKREKEREMEPNAMFTMPQRSTLYLVLGSLRPTRVNRGNEW
jgi:hypothetical protein